MKIERTTTEINTAVDQPVSALSRRRRRQRRYYGVSTGTAIKTTWF